MSTAALAQQARPALESAGHALEPGTRALMEARFGHDFGQVRVHTDGKAAEAAKALHSLAFTHGQDIVFAEGQYQPQTLSGQRLLAHELAHTVQQRGAPRRLDDAREVSHPGATLEREAEAVSARVANGATVDPSALTVGAIGARGVIARRVAPTAVGESEQVMLDSTRVIDTLVRTILLSLQVDPSDSSERVRRQLEPLPATVRDAVVAKLRVHVALSRLEALLPMEPASSEATASEEYRSAQAEGLARGNEPSEPRTTEEAAREAWPSPGAESTASPPPAVTEALQAQQPPAEVAWARARGVDPGATDSTGASITAEGGESTRTDSGLPAQESGTQTTRAGSEADSRGGTQTETSSRNRSRLPTARSEPQGGAATPSGARDAATGSTQASPLSSFATGIASVLGFAPTSPLATSPGAAVSGGTPVPTASPSSASGAGATPEASRGGASSASTVSASALNGARAARERSALATTASSRGERASARSEASIRGPAIEGAVASSSADERAGAGSAGSPSEALAGASLVSRDSSGAGSMSGAMPAQSEAPARVDASGVAPTSSAPTAQAGSPAAAGAAEPASVESAGSSGAGGVAGPAMGADATTSGAGASSAVGGSAEMGASKSGAGGPASDVASDGASASAGGPEGDATASATDAGAQAEESGTSAEATPDASRDESAQEGAAPEASTNEARAEAADPVTADADAEPVEPEAVAAAEEEGAVAQVLPEPVPDALPSGSPPEVQPGPSLQELATSGPLGPPAESVGEPADDTATEPATSEAPSPAPADSTGDASAREVATSLGAAPEELEALPESSNNTVPEAEAPAPASVSEPDESSAPAPSPSDSVAVGASGATTSSPQRDAGELAEMSGAEDLGGGEQVAASGGGGGGGGSAVQEPPAPDVPDVSQADPISAMGAVGHLPAVQLAAALGGVRASASRRVQSQRDDLAASPPSLARPSGAPTAGERRERPAPATAAFQRRVERAPEGRSVPVAQPTPLPQAPVLPTAAVAAPRITGTAEVSAAEVQQVASAVRDLPTRDAALEVSVGSAPTLNLEGNADPSLMREQRARLEVGTQEALAQGQHDVVQPMGEDSVLPEVPEETLRARPASGGGASGPRSGASASSAAGGPATASGGGDDVALSVIAEQERGEEIRASVTQARADLGARVREHGEQSSAERARSQESIDQLVDENTGAQSAERSRVRGEVQARREEWRREQGEAVAEGRDAASEVGAQGARDLERERTDAEDVAAGHVRQGNAEVADAREEAEQNAARERREAEHESDGIFGWIGSRVRAFFDRVKRAIQEGFERARRLVRAAIQRARQLAMEAIERGRRAIVGVIRWAGDRLLEIGDRLLAAFPRLRERFHRLIEEGVARAEATVNRLADALKEGVQRALDLLGSALDSLLGLLEQGLLAAVDAVNQAVQGALNAARAIAQALGMFAQLIRDIAANPGQWLRNLGAAVVDGIRNHLVNAFRQAIRQWFNDTVEGLLGLGSTLLNLLRNGGISFQRIAQMAWEGLRSVIPMMLVQLLIERLVSMIVPAAGAVLAIIQGLQAAWGTISRIIQAFQQFFAFLRAVKDGNAGPQFAQALASAAIVVIQFVAFFLLRRLVRPAARIGQRLRAMAQRIGRMLQRAARAVVRGVRTAGRAVMRGVRAVGRVVARGARTVQRAVARGARAVRQRLMRTRLGRLMRRGWRGVRQRVQRARERIRQWRERRRAQQPTPQQRLDRAVTALRPRVEALIRRGVSRLRMRAQLAAWRVWYRLTALEARLSGHALHIRARVNPEAELAEGYTYPIDTLLRILREVADEFFRLHLGRRTQADRAAHDADLARMQTSAQQAQAYQPGPNRASTGVFQPTRPLDDLRLATEMNRRRGPQRSHDVFHGESGGPTAQTRQRAGGGRFMESVDATTGSAGGGLDYDQIVENLTGAGIRPDEVANVLRDMRMGRRLDASVQGQVNTLAQLRNLMFNVEVQRDRRNLVFSAMTEGLLASGDISVEEAFSRTPGRGLHPATMQNASAGFSRPGTLSPFLVNAHGGNREQARVTTDAARAENHRRQIALLQRWFQAQVAAGNEPVAHDTESLRRFILAWVEHNYQVA
ncbi:DUF4157 domain-containing protein [Myxococcaceae bacterium JPH2]|nr:DUF4157 domain-containing protein [Myxococcaceae bacterium JPH2]